jgi:hypothetical protein
LVEHLVCNQAVVGSSPVASTLPELGSPSGPAETALPLARKGFFENKVNRIRRGHHDFEIKVVKLLRVHGGCLGVQSRRRT